MGQGVGIYEQWYRIIELFKSSEHHLMPDEPSHLIFDLNRDMH